MRESAVAECGNSSIAFCRPAMHVREPDGVTEFNVSHLNAKIVDMTMRQQSIHRYCSQMRLVLLADVACLN
jgi:hypothetical protein